MRWESTYVAGLGVWLPAPRAAEDAVKAGDYDPVEFEANGIVSALVADEPAPQMAVRAAEAAIADAARPVTDYVSVFHASLWFQGVDMWPAASYVARHAVSDRVPSYELLQQCNGGMAGLELAAIQLSTHQEPAAALITTGDRFAEPGVHRWRSEQGIIYGDGATALVLSNDSGFARLVSTATAVDNSLEQVVRGTEWHENPGSRQLDLTTRIGSYPGGMTAVRQAAGRLAQTVRSAIDQALADAKAEIADIAYAVIPASGRTKMEWAAHQLIGIEEERTNWEFGRTAGHLGAGDQFAGLHNAVTTGLVGKGDKVLIVGGGAGFTCTCAVVEILSVGAPA
jgi:3-oxoacyl-[acyl-carrier-protein] synthase-3